MRLFIASDGASRGNPGPAGAGAVLRDERGRIVGQVCKYLGRVTNNQAEYAALVLALEAALELGADAVEVTLDSELLVRQINGAYRVRSPQLVEPYERVRALLRRFESAQVSHVRRENNTLADKLANRAIDERADARPRF